MPRGGGGGFRGGGFRGGGFRGGGFRGGAFRCGLYIVCEYGPLGDLEATLVAPVRPNGLPLGRTLPIRNSEGNHWPYPLHPSTSPTRGRSSPPAAGPSSKRK